MANRFIGKGINQMTLTEYFAEKWLKECGYKNIEFRSWTTPDFIADDDYYEIKKLSGNSIVFGWGQFATLKKLKNVTILLYDCRYKLIETIPFSEFKQSYNKCRGYNVIGARIDKLDREVVYNRMLFKILFLNTWR